MASTQDSRVEKFPEQSLLYSYINSASLLFSPQLFTHQALIPPWSFHPPFFHGWPSSIPYISPNEYNLMNSINQRLDADITNNNYVSNKNHSVGSGSVSPASHMDDSVEINKFIENHHHVIERSKKVFECKTCKKTFGYKHVLQNHEKIHSGEKSYSCTKCGRNFRRDHHLKVHMRLHSGEKPYACLYPNCDKKFVQVANQRRHMKIHENSNLQVHKKLLTSKSCEESSELQKCLIVPSSDRYGCSFITSNDLSYEIPEQSEPEDLSSKNRSRIGHEYEEK